MSTGHEGHHSPVCLFQVGWELLEDKKSVLCFPSREVQMRDEREKRFKVAGARVRRVCSTRMRSFKENKEETSGKS
jgi:hypothetical protein